MLPLVMKKPVYNIVHAEASFQKIAHECERFGKLIVARGFENLPKVQ